MPDAAPAVPSQPENELPYVGLRPFERHESDRLFGRNRDAQILCDRTLSGRLTILYAQSGLGKSSLLRALVIPKLEASKAHVVYFDSWAQEDPWHALRDALLEVAARLGVKDAGRGSPTLIELVRLINNVDEQSTVLILDQFEEFLVHHAQDLDPLRNELAALVRSPRLDAAVVLSLREEFLAALEPFRQQIPNLFQGAYRLEPLAESDLSDAICRPAEFFGGRCEQEMADQLVRDLRQGQADPSAGTVPLVELPMLQLVCQELWKHAAGGQLSHDLYRSMGGAQRILDAYVRELMPRNSSQQSLTARLLVPLAPPSGLKMSYAVEDLSTMTGLDLAATAAELERLSRARILRPRQYHNRQRFELEHDAFIPVLSAWRDSILERDRRWKVVRRAVIAGVAALTVSSAAVLYFSRQARAVEKAALLRAALSAGDPLVSALAISELGDSPTAEQNIAEVHQIATSAIPAVVLRNHDPDAKKVTVIGAWFTPDDKQISTLSEDGVFRFWNADGRGNPTDRAISGGAKLTAVALSPDRQWIAAGMDNGDLLLGRGTGTDFKRIPQHEAKVTALALSANAEHILAGYDDNHVRIWNRDGTLAAKVGTDANGHTSQISSVQFDASGRRALTASFDGTAKIWSVDKPTTPLATLGGDRPGLQKEAAAQARQIFSAAFSPDGQWVVCGLQDGRALIFSSDGNADPIELKGHDEPVTSVSFSPDGLRVVTGSQDRTARVWELRRQSTQAGVPGSKSVMVGSPRVLRGHAGPVNAVTFSPDGSKIVTASADGSARVWWSEPKEPRILGRHDNYVEKVAFSPDGKMVASASRDHTVRIWTLDGSAPPTSLEGHTDWVRSVVFSPDGKSVVTASEDQDVRVWNLAAGKTSTRRKVPGLFTAALSPDGTAIITGTRGTGDATVKIWPLDASQPQPLSSIESHHEWVFSVAFSPDGSRIVTGSIDGNARIWVREARTWAVQGSPVLLPHLDKVLCAVFSPDGSKVATSSADRQARIWDLRGKLLWELNDHHNEVWQIGFSSDGKWLVTSSTDKTAKIWDVEHGGLRLALPHPFGLRAAAFRPRSSDVVTGDDGGGVYIWRTTLPELLTYMRAATTACLMPQERVRFLGEPPGKARSAYDACEADQERGNPTN